MLKKVVGAIATLSFMIGTLGMGYPHEVESQQENAYLVYSEAVTSRMSEEYRRRGQEALQDMLKKRPAYRKQLCHLL